MSSWALSSQNSRLLMVGNFLSASGGSRGVCEELAPRLQMAGYPVITTSTQPNRLARLADMAHTTWRTRTAYDIALVDVYSGRAFFWAEAVCWILRCLNKPYILTLHGGNLPEFARRASRRVTRLLTSAHAVTAPSRYLLEQMQPYRSDLHLIPNPVSLDQYDCRLRTQAQPYIVWLRAFHSTYNPALLPQALALLATEFMAISATMIGPDKGDGSLQETQLKAQQLGLIDRLQFPGGVSKPDVPYWLCRGDIFINTTNVDNTPVSVIEAMACGLCVVSTNVGGVPYLLTHDHDALLVPPNDPLAMAAAIRRILTERGLAERLSYNARNTAEQFDWSVILPQWETLLKNVIEKKQRD